MVISKGLHTALVTPFDQHQQVDEEALRHLIRLQLEANVDGILLFGSTGECHTITPEEKIRISAIAQEEIGKKCLLLMGTGSNNTATAIHYTQEAIKRGADIALIDVPYYNRPSQEGLYRHFKTLAEHTDLPFIIYNNPGRTGVNLLPQTLQRLAEFPCIIGVKETSGSITQISDVIEMTRSVRPDFSVLSGDDALTLPLISLGGNGVISVVSNLLPKPLKILVDAALAGDYILAREMHFALMPLFRDAFIETNPVPIKTAMAAYGLIEQSFRLPLCELTKINEHILKESLCRVSHLLQATTMTISYSK